jgi:transcriptional regulator with XRE-family HTH domain
MSSRENAPRRARLLASRCDCEAMPRKSSLVKCPGVSADSWLPDMKPAFGSSLRRLRERLAPGDVGLAAGPRRRAPGLRREELAELAGISVDYLIRLEQGRAEHPSASTVASLARALQLDQAERDLLFRAAGLLPPVDGLISDHVPPSVHRLVSRLHELPLAVFTAHWQLVMWNRVWIALHGDPAGTTDTQRNLARAVFLYGFDGAPFRATRSVAGRTQLDSALVADLRLAATTYPRDRGLARLVSDLRAGSDRFERLWSTGATAQHTNDTKAIDHPTVGELVVDCDVMVIPGADLRVVVYSAASGSPDAGKLELLRTTVTVPTSAAAATGP